MLLGGSWVVISGLISRVSIVITHTRGLITPLIATHEPPSRLEELWDAYVRTWRCRALGPRAWAVRSYPRDPRFPSSPLAIRVPFFLLFGFNKGTQKDKG